MDAERSVVIFVDAYDAFVLDATEDEIVGRCVRYNNGMILIQIHYNTIALQ